MKAHISCQISNFVTLTYEGKIVFTERFGITDYTSKEKSPAGDEVVAIPVEKSDAQGKLL